MKVTAGAEKPTRSTSRNIERIALLAACILCLGPDLLSVARAAEADNDITFSTSGQSLWGPGAETPGPASVNVLDQSWNNSASAGDERGVSGFGEFGGRISASSSGELHTSFGASNVGKGSVGVQYPVHLAVSYPDGNNFRPGDTIQITASQTLLPGAVVSTGAPTTGSLTFEAQFGIGASVDAEACVFNCFSFPLLNLNFHPPKLPVVKVPMASLPAASIGPGSLLIQNNGPGTCRPDQIAIPKTSSFADKTGVSGCIGVPSFQTTTAVGGDGKSLVATGSDPFMFIALDLDNWLSKIPGAPKYGVARDFRAGRVSADAVNVELDHQFTMSHVFTFNPNIQITLQFPSAVPYVVHKAGGGSLPGLGTSATFVVGDTLDIVAPAAVIGVTPTFTMDNLFENDTTLTIDQSIEEQILQASFGLGGIKLICSPRICSPWGSCCCDSCLSSPSVNFTVGPLYSQSIPTKVFHDSSLLDRQHPPWRVEGFNQETRSAFVLDPNFYPVPVLEGPTAVFDEGAGAAFSASMSSDPDGDVLTYSYDFGDNGTGMGPTTGENVVHAFGDNGTYTVTLFASDGFRDPVPATLDVHVANVAPVLSNFPSLSATEGDVVTAPIDLTDPGFLDTFTATYDWGDGSAAQIVHFPAGSAAISDQHVYADNGSYTVGVCVEDDDGAQDCGSLQTTIANAAPTLAINNFENTFDVVNLGEALDVTTRFTGEFDDQGTLDTHTAHIDWGDSTSTPVNVTETPFGPPGSFNGTLGFVFGTFTHRFDTSGSHPLNVCVKDDDGAETCTQEQNLVVPQADLAVTSVVGPTPPGPVGAGSNIKYTYTVTNNGPDPVDMVELVDQLPRYQGNLAVQLLQATRGGSGNSELKISPADLATQGSDLRFGLALDVVGDTMAVGAPGEDEESAYVFKRVGEDWVQDAKITPGGFDRFGGDVALSDDQQILAISANNTPLHVYSRDGGTWSARTVNLSSAAADSGYRKLDMSGDTIVVAGRSQNSTSGVLLVVDRNDSGTPGDPLDDFWEEAAALDETPAVNGRQLGQSVSISGDTIAATSGGALAGGVDGAVNIFVKSGGTWQKQVALTAADVAVPSGAVLPAVSFGQIGVAVDGDRLAVASGKVGYQLGDPPGSVVIFERVAGTWTQTAFLVPQSGFFAVLQDSQFAFADVDLNGDSLAVGGNLFDPATPLYSPPNVFEQEAQGAAFLFRREDGAWKQAALLTPSTGVNDDFVGAGLDVEGDVVYAGAPYWNDFNSMTPISKVGAAFEFKICEERPVGTVTCGLGTLASGESAGVEVLAHVGCALNTNPFTSVDLSNVATVSGQALDPDLSNNTATDVLATAVAPQGTCGEDLTPPVVTPIVSGTLGDNGWYVSDVTVAWDVSDPDSPIASTSGCAPSTVTADTAGMTFTCAATHTAANGQMLTTTQSVTVKRDTTPPTINAALDGTAGDNGWYTSDVSVGFDCADALSGVASCTAATTLGDEGINPPVLGVAVDAAGNQATTTATAKIDKTPPEIAGNRTPANAHGWNNGDVTVTFSCADPVSGIAACSPQALLSGEGAGQTATGTARNGAGLEASLEIDGINIDKTNPTISAVPVPPPNVAGWNNTAVDVGFDCGDALSGIQMCPGAVALQSEGAGQVTSGTATDLAGNQASASATVSIDATPPAITASALPAPGANGVTQPPVTVSFVCDDALSGVDSCPGSSVLTDAGFGQNAEGTAADKAGNLATAKLQLDIGSPAVVPGPARAVMEGETLDGTLATITAAASTDGVVTVDWGDGTSEEVAGNSAPSTLGGSMPVDASHVFADNGAFTVSISTTSLAGPVVAGSFGVTVGNAAPAIDSLSFPSSGDTTASLSLVVRFSDEGTADTHTATVSWGDGTSGALPVTENPFGPPGAAGGITGFADGQHAYTAPGTHDGEVCVRDDEGARSCQAFSIDIAAAANTRLSCQLRVDDLVDDGTDGEAHVEAVVTGSNQPLSFEWVATADGIELDDPTSQNPTVHFTAAFDRSTPFLVGFNATTMNPNGESVLCQAACGSDGQSATLLGQCFSAAADTTPVPAPALSPLGLLIAAALLLLIGARGTAAGPRRRG